ncbi:MAG TPA: PilZ domain-containing protein [Candidatus Sulfotelmatobacter sp.]|nr:PilZ domain-containing protein [Candidatus Sulfotelmatobacter sp.]
MNRREDHRVQLRLPTRLRWTTPFGQKTEVCTTVDVSRGGVLVPCREPHAEGMPLWVTFPYDNSLMVGQPEVFARVVRAVVVAREVVAGKKNGNGHGHSNGHHKNENGANRRGGNGNGNGHKNGNGNGNNNGGANGHRHDDSVGVFRSPSATEAAAVESSGRGISHAHVEVESKAVTVSGGADSAIATAFTTLLALRFEIAPRRQVAAAHAIVPLRDVERRLTMRRRFVVPVHVRTEHMPWFEETMTVDCSADGLKFRSSREYTRGEFLIVSFESAATSPWLGVTESLLMVVRVESEPDVAELQVAVCRTQQFAFRF